ncbi:MAG: glycosyltransferase family 2 protein [Candidatus Kerfeldbacteria bacterium]|nr:glycosyltransferase family 2 protein [Candidatus Kerfeldbacteria bacterium]
MDISVMIVTFNSANHIRDCLRTIKAQTQGITYEVMVTDNASTDGTPEIIKKEFPWVRLIENTVNRGFGVANNQAAEMATGEVLFILNDDTVLKENSLKLFHDTLMSDKSIGVLGCHLIFPDGRHQDSVRRYPRISDQAIILSKLHNFFPNLGSIRRYLAQDIDYAKEQEVDQVMGACMVMRREVFERAHGFDERFFVWFEEVDLQKRIHEEQGLRIVYSPLTEIIHLKGATFGKVMTLTNQRRLNRSMRQYFYKHHGIMAAAVLTMLQPFSLLLAWLVHVYTQSGRDIKKLKHGQN